MTDMEAKMAMNWLTNSPEAGKRLRAAMEAYYAARERARGMPLTEKVVALRAAKRAFSDTLDLILKEFADDTA